MDFFFPKTHSLLKWLLHWLCLLSFLYQRVRWKALTNMCDCVGHAAAASKLFILTPSGRLATGAALFPKLVCLLSRDSLYRSSAEKGTETPVLYHLPPQSWSLFTPLAWLKPNPNSGPGSKCVFGFPLQLCNCVSVFPLLLPPLGNADPGRKWRTEGQWEKGRGKAVPKTQICCCRVSRIAPRTLWRTALNDSALLLCSGKAGRFGSATLLMLHLQWLL